MLAPSGTGDKVELPQGIDQQPQHIHGAEPRHRSHRRATLYLVDRQTKSTPEVVLPVGSHESCGGEGGDAVAQVVDKDAAAVAEPYEMDGSVGDTHPVTVGILVHYHRGSVEG